MLPPPNPDNESERLKTLRSLMVLDTLPEERFDRLTRIAQHHFRVPIALVSLVDENRQWFKSNQGLDVCSTSRDISFCGYTILQKDVFVIEDTLTDSRFFDNPLVTGIPHIRFYAGAPLRAPDGNRLGSLCVISNNPRAFSVDDATILRDLANCVEDELGRTQVIQVASEVARYAAEAERANKAKSDYLYGMSHELRTPMNAIHGFGELLATDNSLPESARGCAQEIVNAGKHLLALINELLDLAKIESGNISIALDSIELQPEIGTCLKLVGTLAEKRNIRVHQFIPPGALVSADPTRLKQIMINLLSNAIKYNKESGEVRVDALPVGTDRWRIRVQDTGEGIPAELMGELFQPFNRMGAENSDIEGTGIGLTLTRRLVELMNGAIGAESTVGIGSTFWIELPRIQ